LALSTEHAYVNWIRRFVLFHHVRHPLEMGAKEVGDFLTHLAVDGHVAASTQNQALSALLFLYREVLERDFGWLDDVVRAKKPKRLPVVFTPEEAMAVVEELQGIRWLMGMLLYGGGLRLMECFRLRVKDLDFDRLQVIVREGKGDKDRVTLLPEAAVEPRSGTWFKWARRMSGPCGKGSLAWNCLMRWPASTRTWIANWPGSTCFPPLDHRRIRAVVPSGVTTWIPPTCRKPWAERSANWGFRNTPDATHFGVRLPPSCWRTAWTSARSRNCWGTRTCGQRRSIRTCCG